MIIMKMRVDIRYIAIVFMSLAACSCKGGDVISDSDGWWKTIYRQYDFGTERIDVPAPEGYTPFYISHYGRHGARRLHQGYEYDLFKDMMTTQEGNLTQVGQMLHDQVLSIYPDVKDSVGLLTDLGRRQHRELGRRMYASWPEVFSDNGRKVLAESSVFDRCVRSMRSFCGGLSSCGVEVDEMVADSLRMPVLCPEIDGRLPEYVLDSIFAATVDTSAFFSRLFVDPSAFCRPASSRNIIQNLYYYYCHLECLGEDAKTLSGLFSDDELRALNSLDDIKFHYNCGWDCPQNVYNIRPLLEYMVNTADEDIASGDVAARLRFGHDGALAKLMSRLCCGEWAGTDWHVSQICMASNVRWIFARNDAGDVLMKIQFNENDVSCWMPWDEFKNEIIIKD